MDKIQAGLTLLAAAETLMFQAGYVYDPQHRKKPRGGGWRKTPKGWSDIPLRGKKEKDDSARSLIKNIRQDLKDILDVEKMSWEKIRDRLNSAPEKEKRLYATKCSDDVKKKMAGHEDSPQLVLRILAEDDDNDIRKAVAANPSAPAGALKILAKGSPDVRRAVAGNTSAPASLLKSLSEDEDEGVRMEVARNPHASERLLHSMAKNGTSKVKKAVAGNLSANKKTLSMLGKSKASDISRTARKTMRLKKNRPLMESLTKFKKSLGPRGQGRDVARLKQDFISHMDPGKYGSPEEFRKARERIMKMSLGEFDHVLGHILNKDDEDEMLDIIEDTED